MYQENELKKLYERLKAQYPQYHLEAYTNHSDIAYPLPVCMNAAELYDMEATWLTKAYTGEMSLADACAQLKTEADALLAK